MKKINKYKNVGLIISEELLASLEKCALEHYPNECGGFLIGHYSQDFKQLYVLDHILPDKYKSMPCLFERKIDGIEEIFEEVFYDKKQYYVGEWHTHPNDSSMYSLTDLNAMIQISNHDSVNIENPILLILSIRKNTIQDISIYLYDNKRLYRYE
ncbi:MAG: Mov34/MPN/PAD-1 family protein [Cyanobacteria bacterium J06621_8]